MSLLVLPLAVMTAVSTAAVAPAAPGSTRVAVIVSSDVAAGQPPLRYAARDAERMTAVLRELGGFTRTVELRNPTPAELRRALDDAEAQAARDPRLELLFYYSGHADPQGLLLGDARFFYQELRQRLEGSHALVRVALLDACHAGAVIRPKGGRPGPGFSLEAIRPLDLRGAAIIAASTASELAQESSQIEGSYFTHHLLSALRGAGDQDGNGIVTLTEAYRYTYARTTTATLPSAWGMQHPSYDYQLSGAGDLVLTRVSLGPSGLVLPEAATATYFVQNASDELVAEVMPLGPGDRRRIRMALRPGKYRVVAQDGGRVYAADVRVPASGDVMVERASLREVRPEMAMAKGGAPRHNDLLVDFALVGLSPGVFATSGEVGLGYLRRGLRWSAGVRARYGHASNELPGVDLTIDRVRLTGEIVRRFPLQTFELQVGGGLGAAWLYEHLQQGTAPGPLTVTSSQGALAPTAIVEAALELSVARWLALRLSWGGALDLLRVDNELRLSPELRAGLGAGVRF
jgi:hypothetical protein